MHMRPGLIWLVSVCSVAFAEAAVDAMAATGSAEHASVAERDSWVEVCAQSLTMLRSVCVSHPNQRKVYVAVLERLFIPLLPHCGPQGMGFTTPACFPLTNGLRSQRAY